jgi:ribonuclease VapC
MIIDSSAIVAIALKEPLADILAARIFAESAREMSIVSYVETASVLMARGYLPDRLDILLAALGVTFVTVDEVQGREAVRARMVYGRGSGHPAKLNLGDIFTYALAKARSAPLLFVGADFSHTDLIDARA